MMGYEERPLDAQFPAPMSQETFAGMNAPAPPGTAPTRNQLAALYSPAPMSPSVSPTAPARSGVYDDPHYAAQMAGDETYGSGPPGTYGSFENLDAWSDAFADEWGGGGDDDGGVPDDDDEGYSSGEADPQGGW
jgi:hypothetical protein